MKQLLWLDNRNRGGESSPRSQISKAGAIMAEVEWEEALTPLSKLSGAETSDVCIFELYQLLKFMLIRCFTISLYTRARSEWFLTVFIINCSVSFAYDQERSKQNCRLLILILLIWSYDHWYLIFQSFGVAQLSLWLLYNVSVSPNHSPTVASGFWGCDSTTVTLTVIERWTRDRKVAGSIPGRIPCYDRSI